ncbi:hypothetical protein L1887_52997 [Cichorium endivia]|nr:hypothetical protein L1887_52997 [Cichorium endivia]
MVVVRRCAECIGGRGDQPQSPGFGIASVKGESRNSPKMWRKKCRGRARDRISGNATTIARSQSCATRPLRLHSSSVGLRSKRHSLPLDLFSSVLRATQTSTAQTVPAAASVQAPKLCIETAEPASQPATALQTPRLCQQPTFEAENRLGNAGCPATAQLDPVVRTPPAAEKHTARPAQRTCADSVTASACFQSSRPSRQVARAPRLGQPPHGASLFELLLVPQTAQPAEPAEPAQTTTAPSKLRLESHRARPA